MAQQMENAVRNATLKKDDVINNLKERLSWRDKMLGMFTKILMQSNGTFRKAVDIIIGFAKDTYRSIFSREEAKTIKSVMEAFGKDKEDYKTIGTFLMFTADQKENLSNSEYRKASREVGDIAIGRYEQTQKRGNSLKLKGFRVKKHDSCKIFLQLFVIRDKKHYLCIVNMMIIGLCRVNDNRTR